MMNSEGNSHNESVLLKVVNLTKSFRLKQRNGMFGPRKTITAVDNVSFTLEYGQALGIVGESGCGKSSVAKTILNIHEPQSGKVFLEGKELFKLKGYGWKTVRKKMQYVFQDPLGALDPRMSVLDQVAEPMIIHNMGDSRHRRTRALEILDNVGLQEHLALKYPHELSGGQRQRVVIARCLVLEPELLICDEPISALDVSIQAQVVNLLDKLKQEQGIALLFISHDLSVVRHLCSKVAVMYMGRIVELADTDALYDQPAHPYTLALLAAIPIPDPNVIRQAPPLLGEPPSIIDPPPGCRFHPRCVLAEQICREQAPGLESLGDNRTVACHVVQREGLA